MIKIGNKVEKKQLNFWNNCIFHPTDAIEDPWGKRILDRIAKDKAIHTVRIYAMFEDIVYEDDDVLIVNKPQDMVVHPAPGNYEGTLVNAILYHCKDNLSSINGVIRPGIVHRIDKDTSGLLTALLNYYVNCYF